MSKQSEAKSRQKYVDKLIPCTCSNCAHFRFEKKTAPGQCGYPDYVSYINFRCGIGGFAVKKMSSCSEWAGKDGKQ